jgi:hypothetical protein
MAPTIAPHEAQLTTRTDAVDFAGLITFVSNEVFSHEGHFGVAISQLLLKVGAKLHPKNLGK